ncbi:glycosyltransferase [bacterium]|nr:glycosyltransferase [bacterium]
MNTSRQNPRFPSSWPMTRIGWAFYEYLRRRGPLDVSAVRCPSEQGLVSVIVPVYNGERYLAEAIDSILSQTYSNIELIAVDDGSTDATADILARYAQADRRVRVISQSNQRLPAALNAGLAAARGEFLTWTSDDNRMKPRFLEFMVGQMRSAPAIDVMYADYELIDEEGRIRRNSDYWERFQTPAGSGLVRLPDDVSFLYHGNFIGAAFLYRDRTRLLAGDYNPRHFTCEDYDFFLRVNAWLAMRHTSGREVLYQYRVHGRSLTARQGELKITERTGRLMRTDAFRRDLTYWPVRVFADGTLSSDSFARLPRMCVPSIFVSKHEPGKKPVIPQLPYACVKNLCYCGGDPLPAEVDEWDVCVTDLRPNLKRLGGRRGWVSIPDASPWHAAMPIRARADFAAEMEKLIDEQISAPDQFAISIVIMNTIGPALESLARQTLAPERFEIIVINTAPKEDLSALIESFRNRFKNIRLFDCPADSLPIARNGALGEAMGEWVVYLDGAIAEPHLLERIIEQGKDSSVGVVGIELERDELMPPKWRGYSDARIWAARRRALLEIYGFRYRYEGAEKLVAALEIEKLGLKAVLEPNANQQNWNFKSLLDAYRMRLQMEQDLLTRERTGVAELWWHGTKCFWKALAPVPVKNRRLAWNHYLCCGRIALRILRTYAERAVYPLISKIGL